MHAFITAIPGDGIGPELIQRTVALLETVGNKFGHEFNIHMVPAGGNAMDIHGTPLPQETVNICRSSDAVLLGAVGGPRWDDPNAGMRPEQAILELRRQLRLFANLRPAVLFPSLKESCPLRPEFTGRGIDICFVRELTGGIYFGPRGTRDNGDGPEAFDTEVYSQAEIDRIARVAFRTARMRRKRVTSVDKANVLESSRLWRRTVAAVSRDFPDVELESMLVDNAAMQLIRDPGRFDVILTSNMFGDILSDEASVLTGSIGMLPSASLGESPLGLYEPAHGSAPDIVGRDLANPLAAFLSAAMMLRHSLDMPEEAAVIESAVKRVLEDDYRTADIISPGRELVGTTRMTHLVTRAVEEYRPPRNDFQQEKAGSDAK